MGLDMQLEWIEWVDYVTSGRDGLRILGFWKGILKMRSRGTTVEAGSWVFQIWSDQISLGLNW